ncbi:hypothetical protein ACFZCK_26095 [Kitasatospora purpeofusca]|uniref:hypothetical protein n=1 Tax=Kitasatospora purpeofusca TaxID=67352 RepID=UPI0036E37366
MTNEKLRRTRMIRELTQEQVAEKVQQRIIDQMFRQPFSNKRPLRIPAFDAKAVSRLEVGDVTWPGRYVRDALCHVLGVADPSEIGLYSKKSRLIHDEVSTSHRRTLLAGSLAGLVPAPGHLPPPARLGADDLVAIEQRVDDLAALDRLRGGAATLHFAIGELDRLLGMRKSSMRPEVRNRLNTAVANLANVAGWSSFDAGRTKHSRVLFRLGIDAARESEDVDALCHLATNFARQEIQHRDAEKALRLADMGASSRLPRAALAMIEAVRAQALALRGEEGQVRRCVDNAGAVYSRCTDLLGGPKWTWTITEEKVNSDAGYALYRLAVGTGRRSPELVNTLRAAEQNADPTRARVKALVTARLATVLYQQGAREEADHHAKAAGLLAGTVTSVRLDLALNEMRDQAVLR